MMIQEIKLVFDVSENPLNFVDFEQFEIIVNDFLNKHGIQNINTKIQTLNKNIR